MVTNRRSFIPSVWQNKAPEVTVSSHQHPSTAGTPWGSRAWEVASRGQGNTSAELKSARLNRGDDSSHVGNFHAWTATLRVMSMDAQIRIYPCFCYVRRSSLCSCTQSGTGALLWPAGRPRCSNITFWPSEPSALPDQHPLPYKCEPPRSSCLPTAQQQPQLLSPLREAEASKHFHSVTLKHGFFLGIWRSIREPGISEAQVASTHHLQLRHRATQGPFLAVHKRICRTERRNHQVTVVSLEIPTRILPQSPCSLQAEDLSLFPPFRPIQRHKAARGRDTAHAQEALQPELRTGRSSRGKGSQAVQSPHTVGWGPSLLPCGSTKSPTASPSLRHMG